MAEPASIKVPPPPQFNYTRVVDRNRNNDMIKKFKNKQMMAQAAINQIVLDADEIARKRDAATAEATEQNKLLLSAKKKAETIQTIVKTYDDWITSIENQNLVDVFEYTV